jgi:hypothetical protein
MVDINLGDKLTHLYFCHVEHFPMHFGPERFGNQWYDELVCTLAFARLGGLLHSMSIVTDMLNAA